MGPLDGRELWGEKQEVSPERDGFLCEARMNDWYSVSQRRIKEMKNYEHYQEEAMGRRDALGGG